MAAAPAQADQVTAAGLAVGSAPVDPRTGETNVRTRANYLTGTLNRAAPTGTQIWIITNPQGGDFYVQDGVPVQPDAGGGFRALFNVGLRDDQPQARPNTVRVVQVTDSVAAYLASCHASSTINPRLPAELPWHVAGSLLVHKIAP
jgi:hypothetical protein